MSHHPNQSGNSFAGATAPAARASSGVLEIRAGEGGEDADALVLTLGSAVLRWAARSGL